MFFSTAPPGGHTVFIRVIHPNLPPCDPTVELSRETSPAEGSIPTAEEATEATEANAGVGDEGEEDQGADPNQPGIYTEHVFTDPLGAGPTDSPSAHAQRRAMLFYRTPSVVLIHSNECRGHIACLVIGFKSANGNDHFSVSHHLSFF